MVETTLNTGAVLIVRPAPFVDCLKLKNAIFKELSTQKMDIASLDLQGTDLSAIFAPLMALDSSEEVNKAIFKVAQRSTYNGQKITLEIFEEEEAREDYYSVILEVLKVNLNPFKKGLVSSFEHLIANFQTPKPPK